VNPWWWVSGIAAVLGLATYGLARATSREMPPYPEPDRPWHPDPAGFARCPGCGTSRPVAGGVIAAHDYPEASVPFDQQSFPCPGAGQRPKTPAAPDLPEPAGGLGLPGDAPNSG
jgi:hypothetical protein